MQVRLLEVIFELIPYIKLKLDLYSSASHPAALYQTKRYIKRPLDGENISKTSAHGEYGAYGVQAGISVFRMGAEQVCLSLLCVLAKDGYMAAPDLPRAGALTIAM
ncbi:hypothetical protein H109_00419 [Trichophyton interdigitale MR816]|uniref:Uncharacterized protein n=1 Tax=Trichophyton interdigitale (strain MR816) TaxID=1215338 RepID=A0A059JK40_TRIIM|nr:hypothetical protein H101_07597 [Trichophyton interdigitale H6]KDB27852.1 hypothetical protein H109_00419 [Trichophyton interdigitale MR816]